MKNNGLSSLRFLGCAFLVVMGFSFQGCKSSGSGIRPDAATSSENTAGSGGQAGEGGNGSITTVAGSSRGHAQGGAGGTNVAGSTEDHRDAGACSGAAPFCCRYSGATEDALVATCTGGTWTCPGGMFPTQTTETSCCLPDGGITPPVCVYEQVECRSGSSPCGGSGTGGACAGDRYCCPTFGPTDPFPAPYCLGGRWVCPRAWGVPAGGTPGVCCLPDGGTAPTTCVGDIIQCSPYLGGTRCAPAGAEHD
jgi:hypothetical protein